MNQLWVNVNDLMNYFTPTIKPVGWTTDSVGPRRRLYDAPKTPFDRLVASRALTSAQITEITAYRDCLNPAKLTRQIHTIQTQLTATAQHSTLALANQLQARANTPTTSQGIRQTS